MSEEQKKIKCKDDKKPTELIWCKCPKCEIGHIKKIYWTGNGVPRIFCSNCRDTLSEHTRDERVWNLVAKRVQHYGSIYYDDIDKLKT
jgi:hypothetical protein